LFSLLIQVSGGSGGSDGEAAAAGERENANRSPKFHDSIPKTHT
jgi:hypothetical protein